MPVVRLVCSWLCLLSQEVIPMVIFRAVVGNPGQFRSALIDARAVVNRATKSLKSPAHGQHIFLVFKCHESRYGNRAALVRLSFPLATSFDFSAARRVSMESTPTSFGPPKAGCSSGIRLPFIELSDAVASFTAIGATNVSGVSPWCGKLAAAAGFEPAFGVRRSSPASRASRSGAA